jgi:hypothetical protein
LKKKTFHPPFEKGGHKSVLSPQFTPTWEALTGHGISGFTRCCVEHDHQSVVFAPGLDTLNKTGV